jgi:hypothetical protein
MIKTGRARIAARALPAGIGAIFAGRVALRALIRSAMGSFPEEPVAPVPYFIATSVACR